MGIWRVVVWWHHGSDDRVASFDIQVINDGDGTSHSVLGEEGRAKPSTLIKEPNRFIGNRVVLFDHGNSQNDWNSILEIEFWGDYELPPDGIITTYRHHSKCK